MTKNTNVAGTTMTRGKAKPEFPAHMAQPKSARKTRSDKGTKVSQPVDHREPKDTLPLGRATDNTPETETYSSLPSYVTAERTEPVTVFQKFEDRHFILDTDNMPSALREYALKEVGLPYKGPFEKGDATIKVEPVFEDEKDGDETSRELAGLRFIVSRPINN